MKIHSIKYNFAMNAATTVLNFLFPLITFPYVSRILMPAGYGAAEFALSTANLFALVALLGVNTYGIRECAKVRDDEAQLARVLQELIVVVGVWTIVVTAAFYVSAITIPRFAESGSLFLVAGALIPLTTLGMQWFMSAMEQYAFMAVRNLVVKLVVIAAMFIFVHTEKDVVIWVAISVLSTGLASIANALYIFRNVKLQKWRSLDWKRHLKPLIIFFLMVASTTIYTTLDAVMLGYMTTDADVGYYNVATKIKLVFVSIIGALAGVLIPRATHALASNNKDEYYRIVNLSVHAAVIYAFFVVAAGVLFAEPLILLLAGDQYDASVLTLQAIMPAVFFISFTQITLSEILVPKNGEKKLTIVYAIAGVIDIALNLVLIPHYQSLGAAIATTIAECFVFVAHMVIVGRMESMKPYLVGCGKILPWEGLSVGILIGGRLLFGCSILTAAVSVILALAVLIAGLRAVKEPLVMDLTSTACRVLKR